SYNFLEDAYINPKWDTHVPRELLVWESRWPALAERIAGLGADVICLQEVGVDLCWHIEQRMAGLGYGCFYAQKGRGKPDGCATFVKAGEIEVLHSFPLHYADGEGGADSGHVA